jgi:hypothetical protein
MAFINLRMPEKTEYVHRVRFTKLEQARYEKMLWVRQVPFIFLLLIMKQRGSSGCFTTVRLADLWWR